MDSLLFYKFLSELASAKPALNNDQIKILISEYIAEHPDNERSDTIYVMRIHSLDFLYISENIKTYGLEPSQIYEKGQAYFDLFLVPDEMSIRKTKLEPKIFELASKIPPADLMNWHFSFDFRMQLPIGRKQFLQHFMLVVDENNVPAFVYVRVKDVTQYYTTGKTTFVATRIFGETREQQVFEFYPDNKALTQREVEILKCIRSGLTSKEIASKLFISNNTVNNHRKNILTKTGCHNIAQALDYAMKIGVL